MKPSVLCLLTGLVTNCAFAQEKISELDPVTITTSINPEKASQTGRDLIIVKGERFTSLPVHSVDELLRYLPGIEVQSRGSMGAQSDIVIRGGTFQQVLIIIDGLRLNDPNSGHFAGYFPIAPAEIDRIEILKGASSAIYGSEAVGGVIHIITKTFAAKANNKSRLNTIAQITGGEYDFLNLNAGGFFDNGKTSIAAGLLTNTTSGQPQRGTRGFIHNNTASVSFNQHLNDRLELKIRTAYDNRDFSAQNFYTPFISDTATEKVTTWWNQLALVYTGKKDRVSLNVGYKNLNDEYKFNPISVPNKNNSKLLQALLTDEWKLKDKTITSGVQFIQKKISSNDRGNHDLNQAAGFAALNQQFGTNFFVSPALRIEWNERSGWEFIPQVNISYRTQNLQLRASAGKTIRDADFTERFNNYNKAFVASGNRIGNPDLVSEHSISYEAGVDLYVDNNFKLSGTFFQRYHTDLIDYVTTPYADMPRKVNLSPTGTYLLAKNISEVTTTGLEGEIHYLKQWEKKQQLWITVGLMWLNNKTSSQSLYIASNTKFLPTLSGSFISNRYSVSVNGLYKKRKPLTSSADIAKISADYFIINVKLETFIIKKIVTAFIEADNVFDENYADLLGSQMPGRWLMGGIKISLSK